jgi:hypothetical protein
VDRERLAAFVAGELDADEHARIAARLAGDPALRAEVARLEAVQEALGRLSPATPAEGFEQRLRDAVAPALDQALGGPPGEAPETAAADPAGADAEEGPVAWAAGVDELAARRRPRWVTATFGAAAAVVLLGVAGVALLGLPGGGDAGPEVAMEADEADGELRASDVGGPAVLASGRDLDEQGLERLLDEPTLEGLRARSLDLGTGSELARAFGAQLRADADLQQYGDGTGASDDVPATEGGEEADAPVEDTSRDDAAPVPAPDAGDDASDAAGQPAVARCLDVLLEGVTDPAPIPVYVELLRYEDEPAIVYGMLSPAGGAETYDRIELWVVGRDDCQVRALRQDGGG